MTIIVLVHCHLPVIMEPTTDTMRMKMMVRSVFRSISPSTDCKQTDRQTNKHVYA